MGNGEVLGRGLRQKIPVVRNGYARGVQAAQYVDNALAGIVVEPVGGFIQQQGLGLHGHDRGEGYQLFFRRQRGGA